MTIDRIGSRRPVDSTSTSTPPPTSTSTSATASGGSLARPSASADTSPSPSPPHADRALAQFVAAKRGPRAGDGVLYVGMNSIAGQSEREARVLMHGAGIRRAVAHAEREPALGADHARLADGRVVDLSTREGARAFAASLALPPETTDAIADVLFGAPPGSRDELAGIAVVFAEGERGGDVPSRLVLSGHCYGESVWDGGGVQGELRFRDVFALARAMPRAAAQIEDVMLSACNSGHPREDFLTVPLTAWRDAFPNLKTAWAYSGTTDSHSPTGEAAIVHVEAWEHATRGRAERIDARHAILEANGGRPVGYEANVAVWTVKQGYVRGH